MVKLSGGLVEPGTPAAATVDGDNRALIADQKNDVTVAGIDPEILVVVAAGSAAEASPRLAAVGGLHRDDTGHVDEVGILGIDFRDG